MRLTHHGALVSWLLVATPVWAASPPLPLDDQHLYLRQEQEVFTIYERGYRRHRGWPGYRYRVLRRPRWVITRGEFPLSIERFVAIVEASGAAPGFTRSVRGLESQRRTWGWATLGSVCVLGLGAGLQTYSAANPGSAVLGIPAQPAAVGVTVLGLVGSVISTGVWLDRSSRPLFTTEQAAEAIRAYNLQLDEQARQQQSWQRLRLDEEFDPAQPYEEADGGPGALIERMRLVEAD